MRKFLISFSLAAAGVLGLSTLPASDAKASVRVFVDLGDVYFEAGRPYHRYSRAPLHVVHYDYGPRYYHYAPPPRVVHHYYAPPRPVRHVRYHHPGRGYGPPPRYHHRHHKHDRRSHYHDRDRRRGRR